MNKRELQRFKKLIDREKQNLLGEMGMLEEELDGLRAANTGSKSHSNHMADIGSDEIEQEKAYISANKGLKYLLELEAALERIENKTYGECETCNSKIPKRRLEAYLAARRCVACKTELEKLQRS